jgi:hypothetical protein
MMSVTINNLVSGETTGSISPENSFFITVCTALLFWAGAFFHARFVRPSVQTASIMCVSQLSPHTLTSHQIFALFLQSEQIFPPKA